MNFLKRLKQHSNIKIKFIKERIDIFLIVLIVCLTPLLIGIGKSIEFRETRQVIEISIVISSIIYICSFLFFGKTLSVFKTLIFSIFAFIAFLEIGHLIVFNSSPTASVYYTIFETNSDESREFVVTYLTLTNCLSLGCVLLFWGGTWFRLKKIKNIKSWAIYSIILAFVYSIFMISFYPLKMLNRFKTHTSLGALITSYSEYRKERDKLLAFASNEPGKDYISIKDESPKVTVIIVGESTGKAHMSLYGYYRETNPELSKLRNEVYFFNNVVSPHSHTLTSLEKVLTFSRHDKSREADSASIIQLAKLAGNRVYWISNQAPLGQWETSVTILANTADEKHFVNSSSDYERISYDEKILNPFKKAINDDYKNGKVIFIHLMGTHASYNSRYPSKFDVFQDKPQTDIVLTEKEQRIINQYDNAVLYNDWIVSEIIRIAKESSQRNFNVVYFPDHGEEVFDFRKFYGHTEAIQSNYMFEIPFLVWFSKDHDKKEKFSAVLKENINKLYSIEDFIHSLHDLLGITSRDYESSRSVFSNSFVEYPRMVGSELYQSKSYKFKYEITKNDINFPHKLMIHRANSIEKIEYFKNESQAFEVDLVYDKEGDFFDVYHPPAPSYGLSLESVLEKVSHDFYFWLDLKNLDQQNVREVIKRLEFLEKKFRIKKRVVIESHNHTPLREIALRGFYTSLYLLDFKGKTDWEMAAYATDLAPKISKEFSAVSMDKSVYPVIKKFFPELDVLIWGVSKSRKYERLLKDLQRDPKVKIILLRRNTPFER